VRCQELSRPVKTDDPRIHHYCGSGNVFIQPGPDPLRKPGLFDETAEECKKGQWCDVQHPPPYVPVCILHEQRTR